MWGVNVGMQSHLEWVTDTGDRCQDAGSHGEGCVWVCLAQGVSVPVQYCPMPSMAILRQVVSILSTICLKDPPELEWHGYSNCTTDPYIL